MNFVIWLLPFIVLALGYVSNKANFLKPIKIKLYIAILFCAFLCDLMSLSFVNGYVDALRYFVIAFILCDIGFSVLQLKKGIVKTILIICGAAAFSYAFSGWILDGPSKVMEHFFEKQLATYVNDKHHTYAVRQRVNYLLGSRTMSLYRVKKLPVMEERVRAFKVPAGYVSSEFTFGWSNTVKGVRLDLISGKDTLWTLGEGF
jgi:hypothetical protein